MTRDTIQTTIFPSEHDLYKDGDKDLPDSILDANGEVVLRLCRRCGLGEIDLVYKPVCTPKSDFGEREAINYVNEVEAANLSRDPKHYDYQKTEVVDNTSSTPSLASRIASIPRLHTNDYPLWQGPCGEGKLGGITQSMLVRFLSCRERFRLKYVLGLEPPDKWHHTFGYGNMWHVCEEAHAKGQDHLVPLLTHVQEMFRRYPMQQDELTKWWNVCCVQFPEYVQHWANEPDVLNRTPLLQEQVFDVPYTLPSGRVVRLRGKWDSVDLIKDETTGPNGGIYLQENKTKGDIDKSQVERQLKFDLQTMLYLTAMRVWQNLDDYGDPVRFPEAVDRPIRGVRYNVIRRPLSGGKGNIRPHQAKSTKTKFEPAETEEHFYERLRSDYIATDPDYWFFRIRCEISQQDVKVFRETCLDPLLETLCIWYDWITRECVSTSPGWSCFNYRTPFGVYSALEEGGATEYDAYLSSGSEVGLRRTETLFGELQ